jgi:type II secretory pathway component PulM
MEDNTDMQVWLAPVQGARLLAPLRIAVRTMVGMSVIEASQWALQGDAKLVPTAQ